MKNLDTVFPFYNSLDQQYRFRKGIDNAPLIVVSDEYLVPWAIRRTHTSGVIAQIELYFYPTDGSDPYQVHGTDAGMAIVSGTTHDYIVFAGPLPAALPHLPCGYYMTVEDGYSSETWYSETFCVRARATLNDYILLEFSNDTDLGYIPGKWKQEFYIDQDFRITEYIREDTGEKRDGILVPEKKVKITADTLFINQAPRYLLDALVLLPFFDNVALTDPFGDEYVYDEIRTKDPEWIQESYGHLAKFEIQLLSGVYIKKLNFKTTGGTTVADEVIIKQSPEPVLTVKNGDHCEYYVLFDEPMPDANYTPLVFAMSTVEDQESAEWYEIKNMTAAGFLITTNIVCAIRWTAIRVTT